MINSAIIVISFLLVQTIFCDETREKAQSGAVRGYYNTLQCSPKHMEKALVSSEGCLPRETVVPLPWLNNSHSVQMTPTHVSLKRCEGGCHQFGHACLPSKIKMVRVPVMVAKCGIDSGICDKECAAVELEEHTECGCSCQLTSDDCRSNQDYRADLCSCQCRDILGRQACLDAGRLWDESACACGCDSSSGEGSCDAAQGFRYDKQTCSCVSDVVIVGGGGSGNSSLVGDRAARSTLPFPTMEHVVIMVLASIIILLLVFLVSLSLKIRGLSSRIRRHQDGAGGSPLSDADLEVKQLNPGNVVYVEGSCSTPSSGFYSEIAANDGKVYKRESDSLYHSAESVRLKKRSPEELLAEEAKPPVNIIENTLVGDDVFIRFKNFEDKPYAAASPSMSYGTNTLSRRSQPKPFPSRHTDEDNDYLLSDDVQYGTIRVSNRTQPDEYGSLQRPVDLSSYKTASRHIDEALRLLQESADGL